MPFAYGALDSIACSLARAVDDMFTKPAAEK